MIEGFNVLYDAFCTNNLDLVEFLLKAGASPNLTDEHGVSILDWAVEKKNYYEHEYYEELFAFASRCIEILIKYGAKSGKREE